MTALVAKVRGRGSPIVLVHGVGASAWSSFTAMTASLAQHHRVISVDLPGSGQSSDLAAPVAGWSIDTVADALAETLEEHDAHDAVLLGHSLGAAIVARCAVRHPQRVAALLVVAAALDVEASAAVRIRLWRELFHTDQALLARYLLITMTTPERLARLSAADLDELVEIACGLIPQGTPLQLELAEKCDLRSDLEALSIPVTAVLGTDDALVALDPWRRFAVQGGVERLELLGGAHDVLQHRREEVCALLTEQARTAQKIALRTEASALRSTHQQLITQL